MERDYECVIVLDAATTDEEKKKIIQRIKDILSKYQGEIEKVEEWGKRTLSYQIKEKSEGDYLWLAINSGPDFVKELNSDFKLNERILRHLILARKVSQKKGIKRLKKKTLETTPVEK